MLVWPTEINLSSLALRPRRPPTRNRLGQRGVPSMPQLQRPANLPKSSQTLEELRQRAGSPALRHTPIIVSVEPAARPGWLNVTVSVSPGARAIVRVRETAYDPATIHAIIHSLPSLLSPAGLTSDLYVSEDDH